MKLLLIDDYDELKKELKFYLEEYFNDIELIMPNSFDDLKEKIDIEFDSVLLDCDLKKWKSNSGGKYINLNTKRCSDGLDIADYIFKNQKKKISIAIYSSVLVNYTDQLKKLPAEIVRIEQEINFNGEYGNSFNGFKDFISNAYSEHYFNLGIEEHSNMQKITPIAETYLSKKIINCKSQGQFLWTLGTTLSWNVNCCHNFKSPKDIFCMKYSDINKRKPESIKVFEENISLNFESTDHMSENIKILKDIKLKNHVLLDILTSQCIQEFYINDSLDIKSTLELLRELNDSGKFEAVKYLMHQKLEDRIDNSSFQKQFSRLGKYNLPSIIECYKGQIRKIDQKNGVAIVKLNRIYPNNGDKLEYFDIKKLDKFGISLMDSYFEYLIYESASSSFGYHLEPL